MLEARTNLWSAQADLRVVTTNPTITKAGRVVMGRGCARELRDGVPGIDARFAALIEKHGNRVLRLCAVNGSHVASYPVKTHWRKNAEYGLICESARQLVALADKFGYRKVVLPRPGCGNGGLKWDLVKPMIEPILDDRFTVVSK